MPEVTYTPIREAEALDAGSLNDRFASVQAGINDLPESSVGSGAFNENHLPSLVVDQESVGFGASNHVYDQTHGTFPASWAVINSSGGAGGGTDLLVDFGSDMDLSSGAGQEGLLVLCDIHVAKLQYDNGTSGVHLPVAFFRLQARPNGGAWVDIDRTERFVDAANTDADAGLVYDQWYRVPIRTLLTASDLMDVQEIRAQVSLTPGTDPPLAEITLREVRLTAILLRGVVT